MGGRAKRSGKETWEKKVGVKAEGKRTQDLWHHILLSTMRGRKQEKEKQLGGGGGGVTGIQITPPSGRGGALQPLRPRVKGVEKQMYFMVPFKKQQSREEQRERKHLKERGSGLREQAGPHSATRPLEYGTVMEHRVKAWKPSSRG